MLDRGLGGSLGEGVCRADEEGEGLIAVCRKVCHGRFDTKLMAGESLGIVQGISRANLVLNSRKIYQ